MLRPNNFKNPEAEGDENPGELFSSSPVPDRYSTPRVNLTAKSVFDSDPGSGPPAPMIQPLFVEADHTEQPNERADVALDTSFEHVAVDATNGTSTPAASNRSRTNSPLGSSGIRSPDKPAFQVGDLVWAQTDVQFASWPALVIDPSHLPDSLQEAYHFTSRNGKSNKIPVYFYGKNDYDVVLPTRMKDYNRFRDSMKVQNVTGKLYVMFRRALRLADENLAKDAAQRTEWMIKSRTDSSAGMDAKDPYVRTNSGGSSVGSGLGSRKSSMQISTSESQEGTTIYGNAALQMSPLSDTYTAGTFTPTANDPLRPSRFPFPDPAAPPLETVVEVEGVDASPAPPHDHKTNTTTATLLETLPLLNVLGSPRRTPLAVGRDAHEPAEHAALMASASEAVDRALLENYEIVDLSPGQREEEKLMQAQQALQHQHQHQEAAHLEQEPIAASEEAQGVPAEVNMVSETAETKYNPDQPVESAFAEVSLENTADFFGAPPQSDFFPPARSESDIFSQMSPSGSEIHAADDIFGFAPPVEVAEQHEAAEASELATDTDEFASARDVEGSVVSDALYEVTDINNDVHEYSEQGDAHEVFDTVYEQAVQGVVEEPVSVYGTDVDNITTTTTTAAADATSNATPEVFKVVHLSEPSPFDAPAPLAHAVDETVAVEPEYTAQLETAPVAPAVSSPFDFAPPTAGNTDNYEYATNTNANTGDNAFYAEPPRPFAVSPPRSPMFHQPPPIGAFSPEKPSQSSAAGTLGGGGASANSPTKNAAGVSVVARSPVNRVADASSLFGASSASNDPFAGSASTSSNSDMFGPPPTSTHTNTANANYSAAGAMHTDVSGLFGGPAPSADTSTTSSSEIDLFGPPAPSLPPPPTPPAQRVSSAGRSPAAAPAAAAAIPAAVPVTVPVGAIARGVFDTPVVGTSSGDVSNLFGGPPPAAPTNRVVPVVAQGDLFGAPPPSAASNTAAVPRKVVTARLTPSASASDLFGSAPTDTLFGGPVAPPPAPRTTTISTPGLFGAPPPVAHGGAVPSRTVAPQVSAAGVFGDAPAGDAGGVFGATVGGTSGGSMSKKASFKASPGRPVTDAASLFGGSSAADPFSFGAAPPAPVNASLSTTRGGNAAAVSVFAPPAHTTAAADLFGSAGSSASDVFTSTSGSSTGSVFDAPPAALRVTLPAPPAAAPAQTHAPAVYTAPVVAPAHDTASFFSSGASTPVAAVPAPVSVPAQAPAAAPIGAFSNPTTPTNGTLGAFGAGDSAQDLFGAPPATSETAYTASNNAAAFDTNPITHADSADSLFAAAAVVSQEALVPPSPIARTSTAPVSATVFSMQSAAAAATAATAAATSTAGGAGAGAGQPALQRNASAGPAFIGRAKRVDGASPFDAPAPASTANTADVLFGSAGGAGNSSKNGMFGGGGAADPFASAPAGSANNDLFSAPPPGASSPYISTSAGSKKVTKGAKNLSAVDVFSSNAPVEHKPFVVSVDPLCPPSAPGVKVNRLNISTSGANSPYVGGNEPFSPAVAPHSPFVSDSSNIDIASSASVGVAASVGSGKSRPVQPKIVKKQPPPGMIATPHGYVPIPGQQSAAASAASAEVGVSALRNPLVSHTVLNSLVEVVPEEVRSAPEERAPVNTNPATSNMGAMPAYPSNTTSTNTTNTTHTTTTAVAAPHPTRNNRVKPAATVVSFGFGGRLVCMTPRQHAMASYNPAHGGDSVRGYYSGPVRVYSVMDVVNSGSGTVGGSVGSAETTELCRLLTQFPGPLSTHQPSAANPAVTSSHCAASASSSSSTAEELVREALQRRIDCPLSGLLAETGNNAGGRADPSSEKLLWSLLKLCVDRNGVLCSSGAGDGESSAGSASAAEVRICQLLMGHAAPAAVTGSAGAAGMPAVSVFSGSATGVVTSYTPDMSKSALLHANFHSASNGVGSGAGVSAGGVTPEQYTEIEALLVVGRKEDALRKAIQHNEWSLALLIGSVCGPEKYSEVVHTYSSSHFPKATPLHLLTLMYANVGSSIVLNTTANTTGASAAGSSASSSSTTITNTGNSGDVLTLWRHNLSAILSNKPNNWQQLASYLGYRLQTESKDVYAAHSAYLTAGVYPTFPVSLGASGASSSRLSHASSTEHLPAHTSPSATTTTTTTTTSTSTADPETLSKQAGKYALLGCDVTLPRHRAVADCVSISALRGSEILEYTLLKRLREAASSASGSGSGSEGVASGGIGKSITDIFGWKSSSSNSNSNSASSVPPKSPRTKGQAGAPAGAAASDPSGSEARLRYQATKVRVVLCPLKVRFAMVLADFGLLRESIAYALEARALVQEVGVAEDKSKADKSGKSRSAGNPVGGAGAGPNAAASGGNPNTSNSSHTSSAVNELGVKPFNRHFVRALDEFIDRLGVSDKARAASVTHKREGSSGATSASSTGGSSSTGTSVWSSMISGINLKDIVDMVDGPAATPAAATAPVVAPAAKNASASASNSIWSSSSSVFDAPPTAAPSAATTSMPPLASRGSSGALAGGPPPPSAAYSSVGSVGSAAPPSMYGTAPSMYGSAGAGGAPAMYGGASAGSSMPPHPAGHAPQPPVPQANTAGAQAPIPAPVPASTAQYAPMSSMPPRPGNMVVPPSAHPNAHSGGPSGGALPHSTSQSNLQSVHAAQNAQGPPPANYTGGSDFFEDVDLQSPDKQQQHHHYNPSQHHGGSAGNGDNYSHNPSGYNGNSNSNNGGGMYGQPPSAALYSSAPYNPSSATNQSNPSAWSNNNATPSTSTSSYNNAIPSAHGGSTPPAHTYGASVSNSGSTSVTTPTAAAAPPASTGFFGFGGASTTASTNNTAPAPTPAPAAKDNTSLPPRVAKAPAPAATSASASSADKAPQSQSSGFFGGIRKSILSTWYPDAHDANDNVGGSLEAVYNKETGRWEFPGEENAAPSPSSLAPPTGGPMGGMSMSSGGGSGTNSGLTSHGVSPSPSMSAFGSAGIAGPPGTSAGSADSAAYDPMAALMVPPSRRMPSSYSTPSLNTEALDPLAAMMAPPSSRYSMPHSSSTMNMNSGAAPMPQINVWKPPPVAASAAPVVLPPVVYDEASDSGVADAGGAPPMGALSPPPM